MTQPKYLGRELLTGGAARSRSSVDLPDLGGSILVQELDGLEAAHFQRRMMETTDQARGQIRDADALAKLNAYVIICGCIDADGKKLF
nr:hypothetical protein [Caldilineaceae bacterium]